MLKKVTHLRVAFHPNTHDVFIVNFRCVDPCTYLIYLELLFIQIIL